MMAAKTGPLLLLLVFLSAWTDDFRSAVSPLAAPSETYCDPEYYPYALHYKEQITERIETPPLTGLGLKTADLLLTSMDPGADLADVAPVVVSGAVLHYLFMSLQR